MLYTVNRIGFVFSYKMITKLELRMDFYWRLCYNTIDIDLREDDFKIILLGAVYQ